MAAQTLYREGRLSVSAIGEKLHISKSTLYSYLRHRGVEIGAYQKSARSRDQQITASSSSPAEPPAVERVATVTLRLAVVNNSKFVHGRVSVRWRRSFLPRLPLLGEFKNFEAEFVGVRDVRIERSACPSDHIFMLGMVWITDCVEEVFVSGKAADVLGRASADNVGEPGV